MLGGGLWPALLWGLSLGVGDTVPQTFSIAALPQGGGNAAGLSSWEIPGVTASITCVLGLLLEVCKRRILRGFVGCREALACSVDCGERLAHPQRSEQSCSERPGSAQGVPEEGQTGYWGKFLPGRGYQALAQLPRNCGGPVPGGI